MKEYSNRLHNLKNEVTERIQMLQDTGLQESMQESIGELSLYDNHPGDIASEVYERSKDIALLNNNRVQLEKIDDALDKINKGTYGVCDECGQTIDIDRLDVLPETTKCINCRENNI